MNCITNESNERSNRQMHRIDRNHKYIFDVMCCLFVIGTAQVVACFCFFSFHFSKHFHLGIEHWKRSKRDNNILLWYFTLSSGLRTFFRSVQFSSARLMGSAFFPFSYTYIFVGILSLIHISLNNGRFEIILMPSVCAYGLLVFEVV